MNRYLFKTLLTAITVIFFFCGCKKYTIDVPFIKEVKEKEEKKKEPKSFVSYQATEDINPSIYNRPSPVVVKVFYLTSRTAFDNNDFFVMYNNPKAALGGDLVADEEYIFSPGMTKSMEIKPAENVKFMATIVAYRDLDNSRWKAITKIDPKEDNNILISIKRLSVYMEDNDNVSKK